MPTQIWEVDVVIADNFQSFPTNGDLNTFYIDMSTSPDEDPENGTFYYYDGAQYLVVVGPHPRPR